MAFGDCRPISEDNNTCDLLRDDGMYIFDWDTLEWHNEDVTLLSFGNKGSRAYHVIEKGTFLSARGEARVLVHLTFFLLLLHF